MAGTKRCGKTPDETIAATIARRRNAARAVWTSQTLSIWLLQVTRLLANNSSGLLTRRHWPG
jgi:hypothetical protein